MAINYILTVPHLVCPIERPGDHMCDKVANLAAYFMERRLLSPNNIVNVIRPQLPRTEVDMNRPEGRLTPERVGLRSLLRLLLEPVVLFDVHSFNSGAHWPDVGVVIFDLDPPQDFSIEAVRHLGRDAALLKAPPFYDIIRECRPMSRTAVVLEFNEDRDTEDIDGTARAIASFANRYFIKN
jgi:hypothetical protein